MTQQKPVFRVPEIGEECVSVALRTLGKRGKRIEGVPDPCNKRIWISWLDGRLERAKVNSLVAQSQYQFTLASKIRVRRES